MARRRSGGAPFLARLGAAAALALWPFPPAARAAARATIYQRIWDADQAASGIPAIAMDEAGDPARGFVRVDERGDARSRTTACSPRCSIPAHKRRTYDLCKALFDNYRLDQTKPEDNRPEEAREILALLEAVADSAPMAAARAHLEGQRGASYSRDAWQELIFDSGSGSSTTAATSTSPPSSMSRSASRRAATVNGHHFWYKYYLDDWAAFSGAGRHRLRRQPLRRSAPARRAG